MTEDQGFLGDLLAMAAQGETPRQRRLWSLSIVFLIVAAVLGVWGLGTLWAGFTYGYYRVDAAEVEAGVNPIRTWTRASRDSYAVVGEVRDDRATVFNARSVEWVYAPIVPIGRRDDDQAHLYYAAPMAQYMRVRNDQKLLGRLTRGVDDRAATLFADAGHPVPPRAYTLTDDGERAAYIAGGETLLIIALVLALLALAAIRFATRPRESRESSNV